MAETGIRAVFAANLRRERKAREWTQADLGRKAGLSRTAVSLAETGTHGVTLETAALLAGGLGVPLAALITRDGESQ